MGFTDDSDTGKRGMSPVMRRPKLAAMTMFAERRSVLGLVDESGGAAVGSMEKEWCLRRVLSCATIRHSAEVEFGKKRMRPWG